MNKNMLYVVRNAEGRIIGLSETHQDGAEPADLKNPEVLSFLSSNDDDFNPDQYLDRSDIAIARIVEDLIELLVTRNLIIFTDLPDAAQRKLLTRKLARTLINNEEDDSDIKDSSTSSILSDDSDFL